MKSGLLRIVIFGATALIGLFAIGCESKPVPNDIVKPVVDSAAAVPAVDYAQVLERPEDFDGRMVRLRGQLGNSMHGYFFVGERCPDVASEKRIAIGFLESKKNELWTRLNEMFRRNERVVCVTGEIVGTFWIKDRFGTSDAVADRTRLQFELVEFIQSKAKSENQ